MLLSNPDFGCRGNTVAEDENQTTGIQSALGFEWERNLTRSRKLQSCSIRAPGTGHRRFGLELRQIKAFPATEDRKAKNLITQSGIYPYCKETETPKFPLVTLKAK
jgi:hypothetical protein